MSHYLYKRREHHVSNDGLYFLTFSCFDRKPLFTNHHIAKRFIERLTHVTSSRVYAWVVMPEHVHLVIRLKEDRRVADGLREIKTPFAREVLNRWRELEWTGLKALGDEKGFHFWQEGGGYERALRSSELGEKIRYIHANPVRRGLVLMPVEYQWSSARQYEGIDGNGPRIPFDELPELDGRVT